MQKRRIKDSELRKYKINDCLLKKPIGEHRLAVRTIPKLLGISLNTFHNYRNILLNDEQDIPHETVVRFEQLFELQKGSLLNKAIKTPPLRELFKNEFHDRELIKSSREFVIEHNGQAEEI